MARIPVRVHPRSSRSEVRAESDNTISIWTHAAPVDGKANEAVCRSLAEILRLPLSAVEVAVGARGRLKIVAIAGLSEDEVLERLRGAPTP